MLRRLRGSTHIFRNVICSCTLAHLTDIPSLGTLPFLPLSGDVERDRRLLGDLFSCAVDRASILG
jgi:hypothetical protein